MRVTKSIVYTEAAHTVAADIAGVPDEPVESRSFTPDRIVAKYFWRTQIGGGWSCSGVEVSGPWVGPHIGRGSVLYPVDNAPAWAKEFVATNRPISDVNTLLATTAARLRTNAR